MHQKFANIVIRRQLELANLASTLTKTQKTLWLGQTARQQQMGFLHVQLAHFLLHPMLRKNAQGQVMEQMLVESAHSNPLLGPTVLNSKVP